MTASLHHRPSIYRPHPARTFFRSIALLLTLGILIGGSIGYVAVKIIDIGLNNGITQQVVKGQHGSASH